MVNRVSPPLPSLYLDDETAWLEETARLLAEGRFQELDRDHLCEYLGDMARRDRREVHSRLVVLLTHLLKWEAQPDRRSNSWRGTISEQRRELRLLLESGTLHQHALASLATAYQDARSQAAAETGLPVESFPAVAHDPLDVLLIPGPEAQPG